jgi:arylformamidase
VDAPLHYLEDGDSVDDMSLEILIGPATISYLPGVEAVASSDLSSLKLSAATRRLLLRTRNSELWAAGITEFKKDYVALTPDAAQWVVGQGIRLIGIDYLSVGGYEDGVITHQILLDAGVVVLEGLNLSNVTPGEYELICLPTRLVGADGAPARAVLRDERSDTGDE